MPDWLAPSLAYIPRWLEYQMRVLEQPGCAVAVAHRGTLVLEHAIGFADQEQGIALTPRHRFRVASHSKSFTASGLMKLREQGRVTLEDRAGQHVSGLHPDIASATIAQLLSHTAGIFRDGTDAGYWVDRAPFRMRRSFPAISRCRRRSRRGSASNIPIMGLRSPGA